MVVVALIMTLLRKTNFFILSPILYNIIIYRLGRPAGCIWRRRERINLNNDDDNNNDDDII